MHTESKSPLLVAPPSPSVLEEIIRAYAEGARTAGDRAPTLDSWLGRSRPEPRVADLDEALDSSFASFAAAGDEEDVSDDLILEETWLDTDDLVEIQ